jgi:hypothetical protein
MFRMRKALEMLKKKSCAITNITHRHLTPDTWHSHTHTHPHSMTETSILTSIKSYFRCCCVKRDNIESTTIQKNPIETYNPYTFEDLALSNSSLSLSSSSLYKSNSNSSSSDWSISSSSSSDYNVDYRTFPSHGAAATTATTARPVFHPFFPN